MQGSRYIIFFAALAWAFAAHATVVSLSLKNGDQISGMLMTEDADHLVLSNQWTSALVVPQRQIEKRGDVPPMPAPMTTTLSPIAVVSPPTAARVTDRPHPTWKTDAEIGLDMAYGVGDHQTFYGKLHENYTHPYINDPKQSTRLDFNYAADYGHTEDQLSSDDMQGGLNSEYDLNRKFFIMDEELVGYDHVRKIDLRYELGPGLGYHLVQAPQMQLNTSVGMTYQAQYGHDGATDKDFYLRLSEDYKWLISQTVELTEKLDYFPKASDPDMFRTRFELNLKYKFLQHLSLNFTIQDLYDSHPADAVSKNELKIRSSLGIAF